MITGASWIIGPQLIGVLIALIGAIQFYFPPKRINNYYGYRMPSAQKNQETWDEANHYSALYMIKCGIVIVIIGFDLTFIFRNTGMPQNVRDGLAMFCLIISGMAPVLVMIVATERHLEKKFDKNK